MKLQLTIFYLILLSTPVLLVIGWWSRMELEKYLSRPTNVEDHREYLERCIRAFIALCRAIEKAKEKR
jgi:hypothetical protein